MNKKRIKVFIASSTEGLSEAKAIQKNLQNNYDIELWDQGFFYLGHTTLDSLLDNVVNFDFVIIVLSADDIIHYREQKYYGPRDNLIFEFGLFIGKIGMKRTFFVYDDSVNLKLPSDISGYTGATYKKPKQPLEEKEWVAALSAASNKIKKSIEQQGPRQKSLSNNHETKIDVYYYDKGFTESEADSLIKKLTPYNFQIKKLKHAFNNKPDSIFIGSHVKADIARIVIEQIGHPIKYIFRPDYPESEGGDSEGLKIGIGYSSMYNSSNRGFQSEPVKVTALQLKKLLHHNLSNTAFQISLFRFTIVDPK